MIPALVSLVALRDRLDLAIVALEPLLPVLDLWTSSQESAAQEPAQDRECTRIAPDDPDPSYGAPRPIAGASKRPLGLFDPLPPARRATNGASSPTAGCEVCGAAVKQAPRGARRRYCSDGCRAEAKAKRTAARSSGNGLAPLPDTPERPFTALAMPDDARSDPDLLRPPPVSCLPG
jgi:hypothetical protein